MKVRELVAKLKIKIDKEEIKKINDTVNNIFKKTKTAINEVSKDAKKAVEVTNKELEKTKDQATQIKDTMDATWKVLIAGQLASAVSNIANHVSDLAGTLELAKIRLGAFLDPKDLNRVYEQYKKISEVTRGMFSKTEFLKAAKEFVRAGGTIDDFEENIQGISLKSLALGENLSSMAVAFQNAIKSADLSQLARAGFITHDLLKHFNRLTKGYDIEAKRWIARNEIIRKGLKLTDNQLEAAQKTINSYAGGIKRANVQLERIKISFGNIFKELLFSKETMAKFLQRIADSPVFMFITKFGMLQMAIAGVVGAVILLGKVGKYLSGSDSIFSSIFSTGTLKFGFITAGISALVLALEDLKIEAKGGKSAITPL